MLTECEIVMRTLEDEIDCETNNRNPTFLINYYSTYIEQEEQYNKGELMKPIFRLKCNKVCIKVLLIPELDRILYTNYLLNKIL